MRLRLVAFAGLSLAIAAPAAANTLNFGAINPAATTCSLAGSAGDRSCTHTGSTNNGVNDNVASANVRGQASTDHAVTGIDPTAIADITITYDLPYTVTRTVTTSGLNATFPLQTITFNANWSGSVAKDNSQVAGGLGNAVAFNASFTSLGGLFGAAAYTGASQLGGGGFAATNLNRTVPDPTYATTVNFSGAAAGEISFAFQIPTDYRAWSDLLVPYGTAVPSSYTQSFSDTLRVSFRLRTESRPSGSVSTTGGESLACFGQTSPLGSFTLDNNAGVNCGSGFDITATSSVTGNTVLQIIPEPTTALLLGGAIAGLALVGVRKRR